MHILHVLDHSIPLHSGYAFRSRAIIEGQRALGWQTSHLTSSKHYPGGASEEDVDSLHFFRSAAVPGWIERVPLVNQYAVVEILARRLYSVCQLVRPDILHAHSPCLVGLAALRVGRRLGIPLVYEMRASWEDAAADHGTTREGSLRYRASRALETFVLQRANAVTTICEGLRADIISRGIPASAVTVIPNGVDIEKFSGANPDAGLATELGLADCRILGFAGSFYAYEGLDTLLRAMPEIVARRSDVKLLLIGGGPEEASLRKLAGELNIEHAVVFTGRVPHQRISALYDLVDIFVYPRVSSRLTETVTPLKPLEAMSKCRMVIASNVGGHRELVRDGETGMLFPPGRSDLLADVTVKLLDKPDSWRPMQRAARRFVERERTWQACIERYRPVYAGLGRGELTTKVDVRR